MPRRSTSALTVVLTSLALLLAAASIAQAAPPITWQPGEVRQTLGNGAGFTADSTLSLVSATTLENAELWVAPALRPFVSVHPDRIASLRPGIPVSVRLHYTIPRAALEGTYDGTVHVRVGSRTFPATLKVAVTIDYAGNVISPSTHVFGEATAGSLVAITEGELTFANPTAKLTNLRPGETIAFGITSKTPGGLLRRVLGSSMVGPLLVVQTEQGSLEDVIERGAVSIAHRVSPPEVASAVTLTPGVALRIAAAADGTAEGFLAEFDETFDLDGNPNTTDDQVQVDGRVAVDPRFELDLEWDGGLKRLSFVNTTTETGELNALFGVTLAEFDKKWEFMRIYTNPYVVWVGWFPLVIQPVLTANVGVVGDVSAGMTVGINPQVTATAGVVYEQGGVRWISDVNASFGYTAPRLSLGCDVKGYIGPQLILLLEGVAGPYVEARLYGEVEADLFANPWWQLFGGVAVGAGVRVEILGRSLTDFYDPDLIDYRRLLAEASTPPPIHGAVQGVVRDAVTRAPLPDVTVRVLESGSPVASTITNGSGIYHIALPATEGYLVQFAKPAYLPAEYHDVSVEPARVTYLEAVMQIDVAHSGSGDVGGVVVNALDGAGVGGLRVDLRAGMNARIGAVLASTVTRSDGSYSYAGLPAGQYTAEAGGAGWLTGYFSVVCIGGLSTGNQNGTVTPQLASGETRIILTWGAVPSDLDSHLTGPLPDGTRFHMYYPYAGNQSPWPEFVTLDHDDVTSYGPETTTILRQIEGVYRFSVHDFTNRGSTTSSALSNSGAMVRVYRGSALVAQFNVPPSQGGTLWTVFELDGTAITPVNVLTFATSPPSVMSVTRGVAEPGAATPVDWTPASLPPKP